MWRDDFRVQDDQLTLPQCDFGFHRHTPEAAVLGFMGHIDSSLPTHNIIMVALSRADRCGVKRSMKPSRSNITHFFFRIFFIFLYCVQDTDFSRLYTGRKNVTETTVTAAVDVEIRYTNVCVS